MIDWKDINTEQPSIGQTVLIWTDSVRSSKCSCKGVVAIYRGQYSITTGESGDVESAEYLAEVLENGYAENFTHWASIQAP